MRPNLTWVRLDGWTWHRMATWERRAETWCGLPARGGTVAVGMEPPDKAPRCAACEGGRR